MHGAIDDVEVLLAKNYVLIYHGFLDGHHVVVVHLATDNLNQVGVGLKLHVFKFHLVHLVNDPLVVGSQHLGTIAPVCLIAIVLFGIVGGSHVDTSHSTELTDGKGDFGRRTKALKEVSLDTIGREDSSNTLGKHTTIVAAVMTNDNALATFGEGLVDIIGETLSSHTDDIFIHAVGTWSHNAAESASSKFEAAIEGVNQFRGVFSREHGLDCILSFLVEQGIGGPFLSHEFALFAYVLSVHNSIGFFEGYISTCKCTTFFAETTKSGEALSIIICISYCFFTTKA